MNYEYRIQGKKFILDKYEHSAVKEDMSNGKNIVFLRDGDLMINTKLISSINQTSEPTVIQQLEINKQKQQYISPKSSYKRGGGLKKLGDWIKHQEWYKNA